MPFKVVPGRAEQFTVTKVEKDYDGHEGYTKVTWHATWPNTPGDVILLVDDVPMGKVEAIHPNGELDPSIKVGSQFNINLQSLEAAH